MQSSSSIFKGWLFRYLFYKFKAELMTEEQNLKQISKVMPDPCIEVKICYYHIQDFSDILPYPCGLVKQCDLALKNLAV